ncbi:MAG: hypothetical protein ISP38_08225 [PS1 clade bacterium]|nr:hypothetical protein [PS1 clade bacterium]
MHFFPLQNNGHDGPPLHRFEALRLSVFLMFSYFAVLYVIAPNRKFSAGHVLLTMLTCLTIVGTLLMVSRKYNVGDGGYLLALAAGAFAIFLGSRPRVRTYFRRR